ncbi:MAG TPA: flippase [Ruminococcus flavefaciens]|nr:flippase [Ruminococcus flavefaciens]
MKQPSIKQNFIYNTLYEILAIVSPLITAPYVSRLFQADGNGIYSYTHAITTCFTMVCALGVRSYGQREIAQHRENKEEASKLFFELQLMCTITSAVALLGWVVLILLSKQYSAYYMVLTLNLIATMLDISWFWAGFEKFRFIVIRNSLIKIAGIVLLFTLVKEKSDLRLYMFLLGATGVIGNLSMWTYLPKYLVKVDFKTLEIKRHFSQTLVYFVPTVATSIYTVLDKAMIGWITDNNYQNGYYEQATKILTICKSVVFSINTVVSARMSFLFVQKAHDEIKSRLKTTIDFVLMVAFPITFGIIAIAPNFVPVFFGDGYDEVVTLLYIMAPLLIIIGISNCLGALYFTPSGQRARSNKGIITGAVVNLILNAFMIPLLGANGAACASLIAELTITGLYLYMSRDYFDRKHILRVSWKKLISAVLMFAVVVTVRRMLHINDIVLLVVQVASGAVTYGVCMLILRDSLLIDNLNKILSKLKRG